MLYVSKALRKLIKKRWKNEANEKVIDTTDDWLLFFLFIYFGMQLIESF